MTTQSPAVARAFPTAARGADVVPGRPERVVQVADQLQQLSDGLLHLASVLRGMGVVPWNGLAQRAMSAAVDLDVEPIARAGALMAQSAEHLRVHAQVLAGAQARADDAVLLDARAAQQALFEAAQDATATQAAAALRRSAVQEVAEAKAAVRSSAALAAEGLRQAAALAPTEPGRLGRQLAAVDESRRGLATGVLESGLGLLALSTRLAQLRLITDPGGWAQDVGIMTRSSLSLLANPRQAAREALDVQTWNESRWRWAGRQSVSLAMGGTAGSALAGAGTRAATLPARVLSAARSADGAALRLAIRERPGVGRSAIRARDVRPFVGTASRLGTVNRLEPVPHAVGAATLRDAAWAEALTTPRVQAAAERVGAVRAGQDTVLKGRESAHRKLGDELLLQPNRSPAAVAARLGDTVRYTFVLPADRYVGGAVNAVQALRAEGFGLAQAKCTWGGARYQGVNLVLHDPPTGQLVEVQVHTPDSWAATVRTHDDYEVFRDRRVDPVLKTLLERRIGAEYAAVPRPAGVEHLADALTRLGTDTVPVARPGYLPLDDPWAPARRLVPGAVMAPGLGVVLPDEAAPDRR